MKKHLTKIITNVIIVVMLFTLIPTITGRISAEKDNKNVTVSLLYNDLRVKVSEPLLMEKLDEYKKIGVTDVTIMEEDINNMILRGEITSIKYNVLLHKYDKESMDIADYIKANYPEVAYESILFMAPRAEGKEKLATMLPLKYTEGKDYVFIGSIGAMDIYAFLNGKADLYDIALSYDENVIKKLYDMGFSITLSHKVKNYENQGYLLQMDRLIKTYGINKLIIKEGAEVWEKREDIKANHEGIIDIINENDLTLVVTETTKQLSNQKCFGYNEITEAVMASGGTNKIIRAYETYDDSQDTDDHTSHRINQLFNSTVDRNIRFSVITQVKTLKVSASELADCTFNATKTYIERIKDAGFSVNEEVKAHNYMTAPKIVHASSAVIGVMLLLLMINMVFGENKKITILAYILSALAFLGTFILPFSLRSLYPSLYALIVPCFVITVMLYFIRANREKNGILLIIETLLITLTLSAIFVMPMNAMLSGRAYYINNYVFRGIKLSLFFPLIYAMALYYFMFIKKTGAKLIDDVKTALMSDIKVYYVLVGGIFLLIAAYYLIRSGNVNEISSIEAWMRETITKIFPARPRTKEFLIGYPALFLLCYYVKKENIHLVKWALTVASAILFASIVNTFCHVFTDMGVMYMRVVNGLLIGAVLGAIVYIGNIILVKVIKSIKWR